MFHVFMCKKKRGGGVRHIYICIDASGCVGRVPSALLSPGVYNGVRTALVQTAATHQSTIESHVISIILKLSHYGRGALLNCPVCPCVKTSLDFINGTTMCYTQLLVLSFPWS
jgi:hypothetical protein